MVKMLLNYYKKEKGLLFIDLLCVLLFATIDIVYPYLTKEIINGKVETWQKLIWVGIALFFLYSLRYLCAYLVSFVGHILGINIETNMRQDLFKKFEDMDYQYFDDKKSGELLTNLTSHLNEISEASHHTLEDLLSSFVIIVGSFTVCLIVNWLLTLIVFAGIAALIAFTIYRRKKMMACFRLTRKEQGELASKIGSSLSGIQLTKAFNNEPFEVEHFAKINDDYKTARMKQVKELSIFHSTSVYLTNITNLILLIVGGIMYLQKGAGFLPELIMFFLYVNFLIAPINKLSATVETTQQAWSGYERFYNIMIINNKIVSKENAIKINKLKGKIEFKNVTFKYKEEGRDILNNFNLVVKPQSKIAIVGETGVGKSTISKIIPRFYDINKGNILIDDVDVKEYDIESLRDRIGHVQQDVFIFWGTIEDNIRYGNPNATHEEIVEASKKANIDSFIDTLPKKYDTLCGERGIQLSGGQKQRIAIARIFLKNPDILILDEATSALDNVTEKLVQKSFDELALNKTTIVIAHRLTTIQDCDEIIVLGRDGIKEKGTHQELMALDGFYAKMYNASIEN